LIPYYSFLFHTFVKNGSSVSSFISVNDCKSAVLVILILYVDNKPSDPAATSLSSCTQEEVKPNLPIFIVLPNQNPLPEMSPSWQKDQAMNWY